MVQFTVPKGRRNLFGGAPGLHLDAIWANHAAGSPGRRSRSLERIDSTEDLNGYTGVMATLLWILAVILVVAGIFAIIRRQLLWGIVLIVVGLLVGPGGVSIFNV
jgi:hypothetical protein